MKTILALLLIATAGCTPAYHKREIGASAFGELVYSLYTEDSVKPPRTIAPRPPLRIGVAEIGEIAPLHAFRQVLEARPDLVSEVVSLPSPDQLAADPSDTEHFERRVARMRRLALDLGVEWIFVFGGHVDSNRLLTAPAILDITIVPAFFLPSHEIRGAGKSAGALVHAASGRVEFLLDAESERVRRAPAFFVDQKQATQLRRMRGRPMTDLARQLLERLDE